MRRRRAAEARQGGQMRGLWLGALACALSGGVEAAPACAERSFAGDTYVVCGFDLRRDDMRLHWRDAAGKAYGGFSELGAAVTAQGRKLSFAMNAGMYEENLAPVGLYIENGERLRHANIRDGFGNFHLKPNGVFWIGVGVAGVMETSQYLKTPPAARFATQSGPMLVIDGKLHPKFQADSDSRKIRNGVCAKGPQVWFAISDAPVTFHAFATLFRDGLGCADALFLDGSVSSLYAPELKRDDELRPLGPIVSVTTR
jgi:uncharacterized protein YigE (DUF2233 family)